MPPGKKYSRQAAPIVASMINVLVTELREGGAKWKPMGFTSNKWLAMHFYFPIPTSKSTAVEYCRPTQCIMGHAHDSFSECTKYMVHVSNVTSYDGYLYCSRYAGGNLQGDFYINATKFTCSCFEYCNCPPPFEPDPDIAGIGVLIAFVATAGLTIIATALHLAFTRTNREETYNPIDKFCRKFLEYLRNNVDGEPKPPPQLLVGCLYDLVLSLSDTQLVTGIAMLSAAVVKLHQNSITVYHFSTVADLAWLSSGVHILTLLIMRIESIGSIKRREREKPPRAFHRAIIARVVACSPSPHFSYTALGSPDMKTGMMRIYRGGHIK
ncbi:Fc.00g000050.m01.CDS01 [Cosmosporella sp. VM-42]